VGVNGHLDLFSGIGGFALAAGRTGFSTKAFCEKDHYCRAILTNHWPEIPIVNDIREFRGDAYGEIELLTGGFPCQPFSQAGKQRGKEDDRYLWPEMLRVIQEAKPTWVVGENVFGIINLALDQVHSDLEAIGYEVETLIIPAAGVDAPHRRDRCWIIARILGNPEHNGSSSEQTSGRLQHEPEEQKEQNEVGQSSGASGTPQDVADSDSRQRIQRESEGEQIQVSGEGSKRVCDDVAYPFGNSTWSAHGFDCGKRRQEREESSLGQGSEVGSNAGDSSQDVANTIVEGREGGLRGWENERRKNIEGHPRCSSPSDGQFGQAVWLSEPGICRVANGIPYRVDRLKALGNAIVPHVAEAIFKKIRAANQSLTK
jgi:DNA (cytosine-5)-methyltransferase 1